MSHPHPPKRSRRVSKPEIVASYILSGDADEQNYPKQQTELNHKGQNAKSKRPGIKSQLSAPKRLQTEHKQPHGTAHKSKDQKLHNSSVNKKSSAVVANNAKSKGAIQIPKPMPRFNRPKSSAFPTPARNPGSKRPKVALRFEIEGVDKGTTENEKSSLLKNDSINEKEENVFEKDIEMHNLSVQSEIDNYEDTDISHYFDNDFEEEKESEISHSRTSLHVDEKQNIKTNSEITEGFNEACNKSDSDPLILDQNNTSHCNAGFIDETSNTHEINSDRKTSGNSKVDSDQSSIDAGASASGLGDSKSLISVVSNNQGSIKSKENCRPSTSSSLSSTGFVTGGNDPEKRGNEKHGSHTRDNVNYNTISESGYITSNNNESISDGSNSDKFESDNLSVALDSDMEKDDEKDGKNSAKSSANGRKSTGRNSARSAILAATNKRLQTVKDSNSRSGSPVQISAEATNNNKITQKQAEVTINLDKISSSSTDALITKDNTEETAVTPFRPDSAAVRKRWKQIKEKALKQRRAQKRSQNANGSVRPILKRTESLAVPGKDGVETEIANGGPDGRRSSIRSNDSKVSSIDLSKIATAVMTDTTPKKPEEEPKKVTLTSSADAYIKTAIPYLPLPLAILLLLLNIILPGFGTILSGFVVFCCGRTRLESKDNTAVQTLCVNIWVGVAQLFTVTFMLVGWCWSITWGIYMVILAVERRQEQKAHEEKEIQAKALTAMNSNIRPWTLKT